MKEETDKVLPEDAINFRLITENIAALTYTVQAQNAIILTLLHNAQRDPNFVIPDWKDKDEVEKEIGPIIDESTKKVNELYGLSKTDKS